MRLNDFPTEVLSLVLEQLTRSKKQIPSLPHNGQNGLLNARFVCRKWNTLAAQHLFHTVTLKHHEVVLDPDDHENEFTPWNMLLDSEAVRNTAQCAVIHSAPERLSLDGDYETWQKWKEEGEYPAFTDAIDRIVQLPNLRELHLRFSENCRGVRESQSWWDDGWGDGVEPASTRLSTLGACFKALVTRAKNGDASRVRSLILENVQNLTLESLVTPEMSSVIKDINSLSILVTEEYNEHGPDGDVFCKERQQFEPHLQKDVLPRFSDSLTTLSLGFREHWGTMPGYFDGKGLVFPHLRTLNLYQFVFSHHDQLDWILAQTSLTTLRLIDCHIASHLVVDTGCLQEWGVRTHDWEQLPNGAFEFCSPGDNIYRFHGTWETAFDRIRTNLTNLTDFRFYISQMSEPIFRFDNIENRLSADRYIAFHWGMCPSPWLQAEDDGSMEFGNNDPTPADLSTKLPDDYEYPELNPGKETMEGDSRAFEALLEAVAQRRRASKRET